MAFNVIEIYSWFFATLIYLVDTYDSGNRFLETSMIELLLVCALHIKEYMFMSDDPAKEFDRAEAIEILHLSPQVLAALLAHHQKYDQCLKVANLNAFVQVLHSHRLSQNSCPEQVRDLNRIVDGLVNEKSNHPSR